MSSKFAGAMLVGCSVYLGGDTGYHSVDNDQEDIMPGVPESTSSCFAANGHQFTSLHLCKDAGCGHQQVANVLCERQLLYARHLVRKSPSASLQTRWRHARHVIAEPPPR
ncbi:hypothetical protein SEUCBS139899_001002 [Sporothrix eucalyptigena]